ncbi:MAG: peptidylprolyl isomerase [Dehalococcoidia bacterium]|nr:peptidylprolyl isomerase [Dehalococcoidia bacterium]
MGKKALIVPQRRPTKRQLSRSQKEKQVQRLVLAGGAAAILLILAIPIFGFAREVVLKGQEPVARVEQNVLGLSEYAQILGLRSYLLQAQLDSLQQFSGQAGNQYQSTLQYLEQARLSLPDEVVSDWINEQFVRRETSRLGVTVTPTEITDSIKPEFEPLPTGGADPKPLTEEEFQNRYRNFLTSAKTTDAVYRKQKEYVLLAQKLQAQLQEQVPTTGPQVHLQAILAETEDDAKSVLARLEQGEDFSQVAIEVSQDTQSQEKGGDLGWIPRGILGQELEDTAFSLKVGSLGGPVEVPQGFYVIRVLERDETREIEAPILDQIKSEVLYRWLQEAQVKAKVERFLSQDKLTWAEKQGQRR